MNLPTFDGPVMVTLIDGRIVFNDAEEWRQECEARAILALPLAVRRDWLFDLERYRGADGVAQIKEVMRRVHEAGK